MRLREFADQGNIRQLAALSQFLISRAEDSSAEKSVPLPTFIRLAHDMGISVTANSLRNMMATPPLDGLIQDVQGDDKDGKVLFTGYQDPQASPEKMSVDQARATVNSMAKRATSKSL